MQVANRQLCEELYQFSGWIDAEWRLAPDPASGLGSKRVPAYDLGYLLRKLPAKSQIYNGVNYWTARYRDVRSRVKASPEDAAAKLCIELFKQGVLVRKEDV
jgi:hypothetical protein